MHVGSRGRRVEIHFELPVERAQAVLRASGQVAGVCWLPYMEDRSFPIATHMTRVTLPPPPRTTLPRAWALLNGNAEVQGTWLGCTMGMALRS